LAAVLTAAADVPEPAALNEDGFCGVVRALG
jgi:hypothetical protein